jgi:hypothetical protein
MTQKAAVPSHRRSERGQALALIGIAMIFLTGFAVLGVDAARLSYTAAEVQSIADAAATAAVGALGAHRPDPVADATAVVARNYVDAKYGTVGSAVTDVIKSITPGIWDFNAAPNTDPFTPTVWTDPNANAARAVGIARVNNLVAAMVGMRQSDVERWGTAATGGACSEQAALPIAIEQDAVQPFLDAADCRSIPVTRLFQVPVDNSCWTSLSTTDSTSATTVQDHIPTGCQGNGQSAGGGQTATVSIGQTIDVSNGQIASVLQVIEGCLSANPPLTEFVVPVIGDNACSGHSAAVTSFARIIIDHVQSTGAATEKGVYIKGVCREEASGGNPGCITGGENAIAVVR